MPKKFDVKLLKPWALEWLWSILVLAWLVVPLVAGTGPSTPTALGVIKLLSAESRQGAAIAAMAATLLIILVTVWKAAAFFLRDRLATFADPQQPVARILNVVTSIGVLSIPVLHAMAFADSSAYFGAVVWWSWAILALSLAWNAYSLMGVIRSISERDEGYREYIEFKRTTGSVKKKSIMEFGRPQGIQQRLTVAFTGLLLLVVVVLATALLSDFGTTLLRAIMDNGRALADRTTSIVKSNISDRIALEDYLSIESKKNEGASFPFQSVSYYRKDPKTGAYSALASTDPSVVGKKLAGDVAGDLAGDEASDEPSVFETDESIEFRAPVILSKVKLGFVLVSYDRQTIYGPYYLTRVKAMIIAFMFLYASFFITYLFGQSIVFPILFLRMGVYSISTRLASMVKGETKVSADSLKYDDRVVTKDEIKRLSVEIGNMATVIRGVVPYISASTLQHSNRDKPTTERRDLAFLFTDIRGFTSICEGKSPEDVVMMLNHYLDLQTQAIIANKGDIDKFVGDEVMAMFDGPEKELNACKAGMAIRKAMAEAQEKARNASESIVSIGIGINSGPVVFGSVGARERMDFTSIGDTVNLAARLEGANKTYGTKSLVTESVYNKVKDVFVCREIDLITVKGKNVPARIFEVLQEQSKASAKLKQIKEGFEAGLAAYRAKKWPAAKNTFAKLVEMYKDEASEVFLRRIEVFETMPPPAKWDGVFAMTVK
jgi:class 3 adenylate cyclase